MSETGCNHCPYCQERYTFTAGWMNLVSHYCKKAGREVWWRQR